jgi:hypothetical protein
LGHLWRQGKWNHHNCKSNRPWNPAFNFTMKSALIDVKWTYIRKVSLFIDPETIPFPLLDQRLCISHT